jgi:hypothetical protein
MRRGAGRVRIGLAIGRDGVTAIVHGGRRAEPLHAMVPAAGTDIESISGAVSALARQVALEFGDAALGASASIALLPPHCDARLIPLPPLRAGEAAAVLRRDAARHFVGGAGARVIAVLPQSSGGAERARPVLAAAAAVTLLEAVAEMIRGAGWRLESIVPAQAAWLASVTGQKKHGIQERRLIAAADGEAVHVLRIEGGIRDLRRVPSLWSDELTAAAGDGPGLALVHAAGSERAGIVRVLSAIGWTIEERGQRFDSAASAAASFAHVAAMELTPPTLAAERRRRDRAIGARAAVAAIALLAGVAGVELWGVQRELDAVRTRRAEIHDAVVPLLAARDSLSRLEEWAGKVAVLDDQSPRWSRALFDIALLLPEDAHLTILQTSGDTLRAEVVGLRAGEALQALRPAASLTGIRMQGVVERDLEEGTTSTERFRFSARLVAPAGAGAGKPETDGPRSVARRTP